MSHTSTTITKPVNTIDISSVLGVASRQVGYLCSNKHGKITIWAKYKPVRFNKRNEIEDATKASVRYGISVSTVNTDAGHIGTNAVWEYLPPRGNSYYEPCRMLDFNGYEHDATQPIDVVFPNKIYLNVPAGNLYNMYIDEDLGISSGRNLRVKDIFNAQLSWYPGILVYNSTLRQSTFSTGEQTLANYGGVTDYQIPIRSGWKTNDKIELWAILSKVKYTGSPDSAPALVEAYYMVPTSTNGYLSTQLDYYEPENQFGIVGVPVVNYTSYTNSGKACWKVNSITCTARNESGITFTGRFSGMIEDEDGSVGSFYLPDVDKLMTPKVDITVAFNLTNVLFQKEYANIMRTDIYAENRATGKESLLYFGKFNFLTGEWEEE